MALLCQHPRRSNGHSVYHFDLGQLALEVSFPDALYGEVVQVVYAFARQTSSPLLEFSEAQLPNILRHRGRSVAV
jgi:hypothetical protein